MTSRNAVITVSEKIAKNGCFPLISFRGTELNVEETFSIAVVLQSFEKIGTETAEKSVWKNTRCKI